MSSLPDIQTFLRPGIIEFGWGHPDPALLPVDDLARAAQVTFASHGVEALAYGAEQGPGRLIELVRARITTAEGGAPPAEQLMITGGNSQALDMLCGQLSQPGDVVLVEAPTYHLALRIFGDHRLRIVTIPGDAQGLHVDTAAALLSMLRSRGERVAFLYIVSTFGNPSGATLATDRRYSLVTLARQEGLTIVEDDPYGELWYDAPPPPALANLLPGGSIVRLSSYAKNIAPGLRLGWMHASPVLVRSCVQSGLLDSGGGVNHFTAQVVATFIREGMFETHLDRLRAQLRARRDALLGALARYLPGGCTWNPALGGYFIWIRLPGGLNSSVLLPLAEQAGVSYLPGERFFAAGGGQSYLRLSFSLLPSAQLIEGARRLGAVLRAA